MTTNTPPQDPASSKGQLLELVAEAVPLSGLGAEGARIAMSLLTDVLSAIPGLSLPEGQRPHFFVTENDAFLLRRERMRLGTAVRGSILDAPAPATSPAAPKPALPSSPEPMQLFATGNDEVAGTPAATPVRARPPRPVSEAPIEIIGRAKWVDAASGLCLLDCGFLVKIDLLAGAIEVKEGDLVRVRNPIATGKMQVPIFATGEPLELFARPGDQPSEELSQDW